MIFTYKDCFAVLSTVTPILDKLSISTLGIEYLKLYRLSENCQFKCKEFQNRRDKLTIEYIDELIELHVKEPAEELQQTIKSCVELVFQNTTDIDKFINDNPILTDLKEHIQELLQALSKVLNQDFVETFEISIKFSKEETSRLYTQFTSVLSNEQLCQLNFLFDILLIED